MEIICPHELCTGCMACINTCSHNAISIIKDKEGFFYPKIIQDKCINCGLCKRRCPINNSPVTAQPLTIYSGWAKDEEIRLSSSSGGAFSMLAIPILEEGGVVFGASVNDKIQIEHIYIETTKDLKKLQGSKYVQSNIGDCYKKAQKFLNNNRRVLFCGTPCQIAGLRNFLRKEYNNLITIDLICHGVPSPLIFEEWKKWLKRKYNLSQITSINFRDKQKSWIFYNMKVEGKDLQGNNVLYYGKYYKDAWIRGFLRNYFIRPSCYQCHFTSINRVSDFTIADWWGYSPTPQEKNDYEKKGVSLIFCNTEKSKTYFTKYCTNTMFLRERTKEEAYSTNPSLKQPFTAPILRHKFWEDYKILTFEELINKYMNPEKRLPITVWIRYKFKRTIIRELLIQFFYKTNKIFRLLNIKV